MINPIDYPLQDSKQQLIQRLKLSLNLLNNLDAQLVEIAP